MGVKLEHIGIAVRSLDEGASVYTVLLSAADGEVRFEENQSEGVRIAFIQLPNCRIELLSPTRDDSAIAKFLDARGEGVHHLCFEATGDIDEERERLREKAFRIVGGDRGEYFFVHPKDCKGSLIEFYRPGRH